MARMNLADSFQTPFAMLGQTPVILIPALIASIVGLALSLGFRSVLLSGLNWIVFVVSIISYLVTLFSMSWVTFLIKDLLAGNKPDLQNGWVAMAQQGSNLWATLIIVSIVISFGTFFFIIPGILLAALFLMTVPEATLTNHSFDKSMQFSFRFLFNEGNFLPVFLIVLVGFALTLIPFIGFFLGNLFYSIWIPYAFLKYAEPEPAQ